MPLEHARCTCPFHSFQGLSRPFSLSAVVFRLVAHVPASRQITAAVVARSSRHLSVLPLLLSICIQYCLLFVLFEHCLDYLSSDLIPHQGEYRGCHLSVSTAYRRWPVSLLPPRRQYHPHLWSPVLPAAFSFCLPFCHFCLYHANRSRPSSLLPLWLVS